MIIKTNIFLIFFLSASSIFAQNYTDDDPSKFYAETKQINQFFFRFNGEEGFDGKRYYEKDKLFRDKNLRLKYLSMIFDNQNIEISEHTKEQFTSNVIDGEGKYLDFYQKNWYAELSTKFSYKGQIVDIILYMKIEKENQGYKWVFVNVHFLKFNELFYQNPEAAKKFLHPMSHELGFMNIHKIFENENDIEYYYNKEYTPDYMTLFLQELKSKNLIFQEITNTKFHFFQIKDYYFEISYFNRTGNNTGWLISNLVQVPEESKTEMKNLILNKI